MGRGVRQRKPFAHGGPAVIFAVDDQVLESVRPEIERIVAELGHEVPYKIVRASELTDPNTEADFWFGAPPATRPGFTVLCVTLSQQVFEQNDSTGVIYRDGKQLWPEAPVAIATPALGIVGELRLLHDGALLFVAGAQGGDQARITGIPTITGLFAKPKLKPGWRKSDRSWLAAAAQVLGPEMH
jgi:hypothetical protein